MNAALVLGHPGHELFVYGWMSQARPRVLAMTDGSGRVEEGRIEVTAETVRRVGGTPGSVFGVISDRKLYDLSLAGEWEPLVAMARSIADDLVHHEIDCVAGDAYERRFFTHDLCRLIIGAAVQNASSRTGRMIQCYEFDMFGYYGKHPPRREGTPWSIVLTDAQLNAKIAAARSHIQESVREEIEEFLAEKGLEYFRTETLYPVDTRHGFDDQEPDVPLYERHGDELVRTGVYRDVLRYKKHLHPIGERIWNALTDE